MGLIQIAKATIGSALEDQVVEYFRCDGMTQEHLAKPATFVKRGKAQNDSSDDVISNGSTFDVAIGQAALLVENGKVHDFVIANSNELAGKYRYDSQTQPSVLGNGVKDFVPSLKDIVKRFTVGGQSVNTMRLMYVNLKPVMDNKIGFGKIPFRDGETNLTLKAQGHGTFEFVIENPVAFYETVVMDMVEPLTRTSLTGTRLITQMKTEMSPQFQKALTLIATKRIPYDQLGLYPDELAQEMNEELTDKWKTRGIKLTSLAIELNVDEESADRIAKFQEAALVGGNAAVLYGMNAMSVNKAREAAAENENGAMMGFMGMGMAGMSASMGTPPFPNMPNPPQGGLGGGTLGTPPANPTNPTPPVGEGKWTCACGTENTGKFCLECGEKKPEQDGWTCSCGTVNKGKFCMECGAKRPVGAPVYQCDQCGWKPEDPQNPPKFCPECGDAFNEDDKK